MFFTHWVDIIFKVGSLLFFFWLLSAISRLFPFIGRALVRLPRSVGSTVVLGLLILYYFTIHHPYIDVLATQLYVWQKFDVTPTWQQAREMRVLFSDFHRDMKWYPADPILRLPLQQRIPTLLHVVQLVSAKYATPLLPDLPPLPSFAALPPTGPRTDATVPPPPAPAEIPEPAPLPESAFHGTSATDYARDWVIVKGQKITGIIRANPAPNGQVALLDEDGGMNVPASSLPQGFLNAWDLTPARLNPAASKRSSVKTTL